MEKEIKRRRLQLYLDAEAAILSGAQSYQIDGRVLNRANLKEIQAQIQKLLDEINLENPARCGSKRVVFI